MQSRPDVPDLTCFNKSFCLETTFDGIQKNKT